MSKYLIRAKIEIDGVVEKHDIVGAIFGQTEGLLGDQFDLRQLQDKGRIGRIQVNTKIQGSKTIGEILIPSNLDRVETALLAALIESVDKVGPYDASLKVVDIVDLRLEKIKKIMERAEEILRKWSKEKAPDVREIIKNIQEMLKAPEPISYGPDELPAGPDVEKADTIILVEGRADVINLLRYGINNVVAIGGARKVPETVKKLAETKKIMLFVDGDHGGDLILKEVLRNLKVDFVARAPAGREVEELTGREIEEALSKATSVFDYLNNLVKQGSKEAQHLLQIQQKLHKLPVEAKPAEVKEEAPQPPPQPVEKEETLMIPGKLAEDAKALIGTLEAILYDQNWNTLKKIPVRDLVNELASAQPGSVHGILLDGILTQRLIDTAAEKNVKILVGARLGKVEEKPRDIVLLTFNELS
ncbi:MAG: DNA primase DnaG [Thermosphaera aggregans]|jgi:DNA primase|uniref:DNA primase DnaG n=1 Tax=Thermosphaera aggregans TaxID=54254 RepID=UPI003C003F16